VETEKKGKSVKVF